MEAELKFERENRDGVVPVGSYLIDAARRLGVGIEAECGRMGLCETCAVTITSGRDVLSAPTKAEMEQLSDERRQNGERLACQAKIQKAGEMSIRTSEKKKEPEAKPEDKREEFRKEFAELPFEEKMARLVQLEAIALGETLTFVMNSPYLIAEKVMDIMADFGLRAHTEQRKAARPEEHHKETNGGPAGGEPEAKQPGATSGKRKSKKEGT